MGGTSLTQSNRQQLIRAASRYYSGEIPPEAAVSLIISIFGALGKTKWIPGVSATETIDLYRFEELVAIVGEDLTFEVIRQEMRTHLEGYRPKNLSERVIMELKKKQQGEYETDPETESSS